MALVIFSTLSGFAAAEDSVVKTPAIIATNKDATSMLFDILLSPEYSSSPACPGGIVIAWL
jgi:hypothetical protein